MNAQDIESINKKMHHRFLCPSIDIMVAVERAINFSWPSAFRETVCLNQREGTACFHHTAARDKASLTHSTAHPC
jgi:hypothetical protein